MGYLILIVVVAIVGGITWFVNPSYFSSLSSYVSTRTNTLVSSDSAAMKPITLTRDIARSADMSAIQGALLQYKIEKGNYPSSLFELVPDFIPEVPTDPQTREEYAYEQLRGGESYQLCIDWETPENNINACITPD